MSLVKNSLFPRAGFRRRIASWLYDALIAIAVYMTAGAASFLIISLLVHFLVLILGFSLLFKGRKSGRVLKAKIAKNKEAI